MPRNLVAALLLVLLPQLAWAATSVCVDVEVRSWTQPVDENSPEAERMAQPAVPLGERDPFAIDPARYLERLVRYEVTHEVGFEAVDTGCAERIRIELYPLRMGWTVFARYTGHAREEKVDEVQLDEFVPLAQRLSRALLWDKPDRFVADRFLSDSGQAEKENIFLAFGLGPRVCIGAAFATIESGLILASLIRRYDFLPLAAERVRPVARLTTRPAEQILCHVRRRP